MCKQCWVAESGVCSLSPESRVCSLSRCVHARLATVPMVLAGRTRIDPWRNGTKCRCVPSSVALAHPSPACLTCRVLPLLVPDDTRARAHAPSPVVQLMNDRDGDLHLRNLRVYEAKTEQEALNLLFLGNINRVTSETPMNLVGVPPPPGPLPHYARGSLAPPRSCCGGCAHYDHRGLPERAVCVMRTSTGLPTCDTSLLCSVGGLLCAVGPPFCGLQPLTQLWAVPRLWPVFWCIAHTS